VTIPAETYCIPGICVDGIFDPTTFHQFAASGHLTVTTPMEWPLIATFQRHNQTCAPMQTVTPIETTPGVFRIDPAGVAGVYEVTLFAQQRNGQVSSGDAVATVVWTTTTDGPLATPTARASVLADHDGAVDSYGVELYITNLATQPSTATATIVVTSADGASVALEPTAAGTGPADCPFGATGTVYFKLDAAAGQRAAALGAGPFAYDVTLVLDGVTYTAHATWPTDELPNDAPNVTLRFDPPLPAIAAGDDSITVNGPSPGTEPAS
jgi:hypothetical protein